MVLIKEKLTKYFDRENKNKSVYFYFTCFA